MPPVQPSVAVFKVDFHLTVLFATLRIFDQVELARGTATRTISEMRGLVPSSQVVRRNTAAASRNGTWICSTPIIIWT